MGAVLIGVLLTRDPQQRPYRAPFWMPKWKPFRVTVADWNVCENGTQIDHFLIRVLLTWYQAPSTCRKSEKQGIQKIAIPTGQLQSFGCLVFHFFHLLRVLNIMLIAFLLNSDQFGYHFHIHFSRPQKPGMASILASKMEPGMASEMYAKMVPKCITF